MRIVRERSLAHLASVVTHRLLHGLSQLGELLDELGAEPAQAEHVGRDEDLAIAVGTGSDSDGRDRQRASDVRSNLTRD